MQHKLTHFKLYPDSLTNSSIYMYMISWIGKSGTSAPLQILNNSSVPSRYLWVVYEAIDDVWHVVL